MPVPDYFVRLAAPADLSGLAAMCYRLWPDGSVAEHADDLTKQLFPENPAKLPAVAFLAQQPGGVPLGFVEVGLRSHADGCDPAHAVGFIEGWYVEPEARRQGVGAQLIAAAEEWARSQGCLEMASDTWFDNVESQQAHEALGFEVVDRCVHYRKQL